jgi:hypothetical protein
MDCVFGNYVLIEFERTSKPKESFAFNQLSKKLANPELCCSERAATRRRDAVDAAGTSAGSLLL